MFCLRFVMLTALAWALTGEEISEVNRDEELTVSVSIGGSLDEIDGVVIYTVDELVTYPIPDVPETFKQLSSGCVGTLHKGFCEFVDGINAIQKDSYRILRLINKVMTVKGLNGTNISNYSKFSPEFFDEVIIEPSEGDPAFSSDLRSRVGSAWLDNISKRLDDRSITGTDHLNTKLPGAIVKSKRAIAALAPLLKILPAVAPALLKAARSGFLVPKNRILNMLALNRAYQPEELKPFSEIVPHVSELVSTSRNMFGEILKITKGFRKAGVDTRLRNTIMNPVLFRLNFFKYMEEIVGDNVFQHIEEILADMSLLTFQSLMYNLHTQTMADCRNNEIPMTVVPPRLLKKRMQELETAIRGKYEFAISPEDVMKFYTQKRTKCYFDDDGGIVQIPLPLRPWGVNFKLFKFQSLSFSWKEHICSFNIPEVLIVKNEMNGRIYPISSISDDSCNLDSGNLCRVPPEMSDGPSSLCLKTLLHGGTVEDLRKACKMTCSIAKNYALSQISDDTFVVANLPENSRVQCGADNKRNFPKIEYGALRIKLGCSCKLMHLDSVIAAPRSTFCTTGFDYSSQILIPAHGSAFDDFIPHTSKPNEILFSHITEILDEDFDMVGSEFQLHTHNFNIHVIQFVWSLLQSMALAYILWRLHLSPMMLAALFPRAEGRADGHFCKLPYDIYVLLYIIMGFSVLGFLPYLVIKIYKRIQKAYWQTLNAIAERQIQ